MTGAFQGATLGGIGIATCALLLSGCATSADRSGAGIPSPFYSQGIGQVSPVSQSFPVTDSTSTYGGQPRPRFANEIPPPAAIPPGFRKPTAASAEEQRTAERLAREHRSAPQQWQLPAQQRDARPAAAPVQQPMVMPASNAPVFSTTVQDSGMAPGAYEQGIPPMPQASPGDCYALVRRPEQYRNVQQTYVVRPASEQVQVVPARYQTLNESVVTQEGYERLEVVPPTFRTVTEQVEVRPPTTRYVTTEPQYDTVTERVLERPARQVWRPGRGPLERIDHATGQIFCLVEEPAVYKSITRRVQTRPAESREVQVPGEYRSITRRIVDQPAQVRRVSVPAQVSNMQVQRMVEPARVNRVPVPEQLATVTVRELTHPSSLEWRSVICETNMTPGLLQRVQQALKSQGFDPGPIDGILGRRTLSALNDFQRSRGLPVDSYLNVESVQALGVRNTI
ncbi:peptidoglycan-binding domain-containing protein [Polycyclovorans algicola]|uniref:peptidoglycan-binding domain-containing protein n=1 Tax=Polycyclovorans algicola TaxID=616992 RepID=UPI000A0107A5|nr:peptidoglycan-binding protein [Polycyclovorans algicola]